MKLVATMVTTKEGKHLLFTEPDTKDFTPLLTFAFLRSNLSQETPTHLFLHLLYGIPPIGS